MLGIIFTIYFYFKSKKNRVPTYVIRTINLVKEKLQKIDTVEILYSGEKVNNLSISKIALWNDGKETIDKGDIASNNPIKIKIKEEFEILEAEILFQKNSANDFKIAKSGDNKCINISFDYFDFEEGIVLQVFHTGNNSEDIFIDGKIKSVKQIIRREFYGSLLPIKSMTLINHLRNDKGFISSKSMKKIMGWTLILIGIIFTCIFLALSYNHSSILEPPKPKEFSIYSAMISSLPGLLYVYIGYRMLKRRIPKGFDIFNDEF